MPLDPRVPGKESKRAAERLGRILAEGVPGVREDLRYSYTKGGFQVAWGNPQEEEKLFLSLAQLRELTDEGLRHLIRTSLGD
jgi:hypothetical protein